MKKQTDRKISNEEYYIKKLREIGSTDYEEFHYSYDILLSDIIKKELGFKKFFEVLEEMIENEEAGFWYA